MVCLLVDMTPEWSTAFVEEQGVSVFVFCHELMSYVRVNQGVVCYPDKGNDEEDLRERESVDSRGGLIGTSDEW